MALALPVTEGHSLAYLPLARNRWPVYTDTQMDPNRERHIPGEAQTMTTTQDLTPEGYPLPLPEADRFPAFTKTVRVGTLPSGYDDTRHRMTVEIRWDPRGPVGKLAITGAEYRGRADVGGGQNLGTLRRVDRAGQGLTLADLQTLADVWARWHLNTARSACAHQTARGETYGTHPMAECPDCGYLLGSKWLAEPVPRDVLKWLDTLPAI